MMPSIEKMLKAFPVAASATIDPTIASGMEKRTTNGYTYES
jgi:hypothetical protein